MVIFKLLFFAFVFTLAGFFIFHADAFAQACTTPGTPSNVLITYPACTGVNCDSTQATCTWAAATGATSYSVQVTQAGTGAVIATQSLSSSTLTYTFPVTSGQTYTCSVSAVNSCGTAGVAGTFSLLCQTDALVNPTAAPALPSSPPVSGSPVPLIVTSIIGFVILTFGAMMFVL